jgi:mannitol/fructose-specific phosphotransferase system IIA component
LGKPHQKSTIDQGNACAAAVLAKAALSSVVLGEKIAFHHYSVSLKNNVAKVRNTTILRLQLKTKESP